MSLLGLAFGAVVEVLALGVFEVGDVVEVVGVEWLAVALGRKIGNMVVGLTVLVVVVVEVVADAVGLADVMWPVTALAASAAPSGDSVWVVRAPAGSQKRSAPTPTHLPWVLTPLAG